MTLEEFHKIIIKPNEECNGLDVHIRYQFEHNNFKSLFRLTGLDLSGLVNKEQLIIGYDKTKR